MVTDGERHARRPGDPLAQHAQVVVAVQDVRQPVRAAGRGEDGYWSPGRLYSGAMKDVTQVLSAIEQGDPHAAEQLLPLVYDELRRLAAEKLAREKSGQ